jgi:streptogrisin D
VEYVFAFISRDEACRSPPGSTTGPSHPCSEVVTGVDAAATGADDAGAGAGGDAGAGAGADAGADVGADAGADAGSWPPSSSSKNSGNQRVRG